MDDWGVGSYEDTASELEPAAEIAVAALALTEDERMLDHACGTGNAAAIAVQAGARVTGLDAAPRLLGVARERVPDAEFVQGDDLGHLPFEDGSFDAAASVFGLIFAPSAEPAVSELARVIRAGGRAAITTWPSRGLVFDAVMLLRQAVARVRPPEGPPPVEWGDPEVLEALLSPHGEVDITEQELPFFSGTPEAAWDRWERKHPVWLGARRLLEPAGEWDALRENTLALLHDGELGADTTAPYLLAVLRR